MFLIIDNYDSFVHTLARYVGNCGYERQLLRHDAKTAAAVVADALATSPPLVQGIIISPGPGRPQEAGMSVSLVQQANGRIPILGVCLGHQAIAVAYGATVVRARRPMHGMAATISHDRQGIFADLPSPLRGGRYHSLCAVRLPPCLQTTATSEEGEVMAVQHRSHPVYGVQFHPESILTECGGDLLARFLHIAAAFHAESAARLCSG